MDGRINTAASLIAQAVLAHPLVDTATPYPPDDTVDSHFWVSDFELDDTKPLWGDFIDCTFELTYARPYRDAEATWQAGFELLDTTNGIIPLIDALSNAHADSPIEFIRVSRAGQRVVLDQQSNDRYLSVELVADSILRGMPS